MVPTGWWSLRYVSWSDTSCISVVSFDVNWTSRSILFRKSEVHHQIAAPVMRFLIWHLAAARRLFYVVKHSSWISLYTLHCDWYSCGNQQISLYKCNSTRYFLPCYIFMCDLSYPTGKEYICLVSALVWIGIHFRLMILQYPNVVQMGVIIMSIRYSKWSCLHMSYCAWHFPSSCSQVTTLIYLPGGCHGSTEHIVTKKLMTGYNSVTFFVTRVRTKYFPVSLSIQVVDQWVDAERESFKLHHTISSKVKTVHTSGTSFIDAYSTGSYEDKRSVHFGETNTKELNSIGSF